MIGPTQHWSPIRERDGIGPTGVRRDYVKDKVRFKIVAAGRRSTKTLHAKRMLVRALLSHLRLPRAERPDWWAESHRYFYGAPTQDQAIDIARDDLVKLIPPWWVRRVYGGKKPVIRTIFNSEIHILGMDEARRFEGTPWNGGVLDEFQDMKPDVYGRTVAPLLMDRKGWLIILGHPRFDAPNIEVYRQLFELGLDPNEPDYKSYAWLSRDVLSDEDICSLMRGMSPMQAREELEASWESAPGRAYPDFNFTQNVRACSFDATSPLLVGCDFNRRHHNWGLYQYINGSYYVLEDVYGLNATVEVMCGFLKDRISKLKPQMIQFYGDHSGVQKRAEATDASWQQIISAFPPSATIMYGVRPQPPVTDRIEKVNSFILNALGESRLIADPGAKQHRNDFEKVSRVMAFAGEGGKDGELTHASSAFGYMVWQHQGLLGSEPMPSNPILFF